jgi:hypothetical protein
MTGPRGSRRLLRGAFTFFTFFTLPAALRPRRDRDLRSHFAMHQTRTRRTAALLGRPASPPPRQVPGAPRRPSLSPLCLSGGRSGPRLFRAGFTFFTFFTRHPPVNKVKRVKAGPQSPRARPPQQLRERSATDAADPSVPGGGATCDRTSPATTASYMASGRSRLSGPGSPSTRDRVGQTRPVTVRCAPHPFSLSTPCPWARATAGGF